MSVCPQDQAYDSLCECPLSDDKPVGRLPIPPDNEIQQRRCAGQPYVFISHTGQDGAKENVVRPTFWFLQNILGIGAFFDDSGDPDNWGRDKWRVMAEAAYTCTHAVVILSPSFRQRKFCVLELNTFMYRWRRQDSTFRVLPALWKSEKILGFHRTVNDLIWISSSTTSAQSYLIQLLWPRLVNIFHRPRISEEQLTAHFVDYVREKLGSGTRALPHDFVRHVLDISPKPLLVPTSGSEESSSSEFGSEESDSDVKAADTKKIVVGVAFSNLPKMAKNVTWNKKILESKGAVKSMLSRVAIYGDVVYGRPFMKRKNEKSGTVVARLDCQIELHDNLSTSQWESVRQALKALARCLEEAGASEQEVKEMMIGSLWDGSLCVLLEASDRVLELLYTLWRAAPMSRLALNGKVNLTDLIPAFCIRAILREPLFDSIKHNGTVYLKLPDDRVEMILPTTWLAHGQLLAGGIGFTDLQQDSLVSLSQMALAGYYERLGDPWPSVKKAEENVGPPGHPAATVATNPSSQGNDTVVVNTNKQETQDQKSQGTYKEALEFSRATLGDLHLDTFKEAEPLYREELAGRKATLGDLHPDTLDSINNLAILLSNQGLNKDAELLYREALDGKQTALGNLHPSTLDSMTYLAHLLQDQGNYKEAEPLFREALDGSRATLGNLHPDTLATINNLARLLQDQGNYKEAESLFREALDGKKAALGNLHPDTLASVNNLARLLQDQGKYNKAELLYKEALDYKRATLGDLHPSTLQSVNNLARLLQDQGNYNKAESLYREALDGWRTTLGDLHPSTLQSVNNLADVLKDQGLYNKAESLYREALDGKRTALGNFHPSTLQSVNNLAYVLKDQGLYKEAEPLYREALDGKRTALGNFHPSTLDSMNYLAKLLQDQGNYKEAESLCEEALDGKRTALGNLHPSTLDSINYLAKLLQDEGNYEEAESLFREAFDGKRTALGNFHPDTLASVNNLARLLQDQGNYKEAERLFRHALDGRRGTLGDRHPDTLATINNLARLLQDQGNYKEAKPLFKEALHGSRATLGNLHPDTLATINNLARLLQDRGNYNKAESLYREALDGSRATLGNLHPFTLVSINNLAHLLQDQGKFKEAEALFKESSAVQNLERS